MSADFNLIATECHCAKMRTMSRKITNIYDDNLRPLGIKSNQLSVIVGVSVIQPVSVTNLAGQLGMDRTTLTRNLKPLVSSGYLELTNGHGRTRNIHLTRDGQRLLEKAKPFWDKAQQTISEILGQENLDSIKTIHSALK